ncbi:MAG: hypothetical protein AAF628_05875 [Planctomycetota bacterium]
MGEPAAHARGCAGANGWGGQRREGHQPQEAGPAVLALERVAQDLESAAEPPPDAVLADAEALREGRRADPLLEVKQQGGAEGLVEVREMPREFSLPLGDHEQFLRRR